MVTQRYAEEIFNYYSDPTVAATYRRQESLTACERLLFDAYIKPGMAILDIGVGGGRTSGHLAKSASRYVGLDYVAEMVRLCRERYPDWEYYEGSAVDLSRFREGVFDAVVMSFNVLDDLIPNDNRWRCLDECRRVLRGKGILIFSSHNPRAIVVLPEAVTDQPQRSPAVPNHRGSALKRAITNSAMVLKGIRFSVHRMGCYGLKTPFWRGEGYMLDTEGLMTHFATPKKTLAELRRCGFQFIRLEGNEYPRKAYPLITNWYYYVFQK